MSVELTYDQVEEMLPAYVLGALEPEEIQAIEAYLGKHQSLLVTLEVIDQAAGLLAYLAPPAPLPANARERLLEQVRAGQAGKSAPATELEAGVDHAAPVPTAARPRISQKPMAGSAGIGRRLLGMRTALRGVSGWAVAAGLALPSVVAFLLIGLYALQLRTQLDLLQTRHDALQTQVLGLQAANEQLQQTNEVLQKLLLEDQGRVALIDHAARLQAANEQLQRTNEVLQLQLQQERSQLALIAHASGDRTVLLAGTEAAPGASGVLYLGDEDRGVLVLRDLAPLPSQQTYQLWLIPADEAPIPAGLLAIDAQSNWLGLQLPPEGRVFAAVAVSVEPAGGSLAPTGAIVLLGTKS